MTSHSPEVALVWNPHGLGASLFVRLWFVVLALRWVLSRASVFFFNFFFTYDRSGSGREDTDCGWWVCGVS